MSAQLPDRVTGAVLFGIALAWIAASRTAIPEGFSGSYFGPRTFPLWLGILLAALAAFLFLGSFQRKAEEPGGGDAAAEEGELGSELWGLAAAIGFLLVYFLLMGWLGFLAGTVITVAAFLWFVLGKRSPTLVIAMPIALAVGIWLLMGKFMGLYLPPGSLGLSF